MICYGSTHISVVVLIEENQDNILQLKLTKLGLECSNMFNFNRNKKNFHAVFVADRPFLNSYMVLSKTHFKSGKLIENLHIQLLNNLQRIKMLECIF